MSHHTQRDRILSLLRSRSPEWVPLPEILALGVAQYNARIYELRRMGHNIENRAEWVGKNRHTWFRLVSVTQRAASSIVSTETYGLTP